MPNRRRHHVRAIVFALNIALLELIVQFPPGPAFAESNVLGVKASFVYQFAKFTSWPDSAFGRNDESFRIGVIEDQKFAEALSSTVSNKQLEGRPIKVEHLTGILSLGCCHLLYVTSRNSDELLKKLQLSSSGPVLTVSDSKSFVESGGMFQLVREGRRFSFLINRGAALQSNLVISSKLLRLATEVIEHNEN